MAKRRRRVEWDGVYNNYSSSSSGLSEFELIPAGSGDLMQPTLTRIIGSYEAGSTATDQGATAAPTSDDYGIWLGLIVAPEGYEPDPQADFDAPWLWTHSFGMTWKPVRAPYWDASAGAVRWGMTKVASDIVRIFSLDIRSQRILKPTDRLVLRRRVGISGGGSVSLHEQFRWLLKE